jgi:Tfp pilus assembly protein PilZ
MTLPLENERRISVTGTVVFAKASSSAPSQNPPGMGIKFKGLRDEDLKLLKQHVERLLAQESSGTRKETTQGLRA